MRDSYLATRLLPSVRNIRRPVRGLAVVLLVGITCLSAYFVFRTLWGDPLLRRAQQALDHYHLAEAREHLLAYLTSHPANANAPFLLARTARRLGAYKEAVQHLEECQRLGGIPEQIDLELLLLDAQRGKLQGVEGRLRAYVENNLPDTQLVLEALSHGYLQRLRISDAKSSIKAWLEREPDNPTAWFLQAKVAETEKDFPAARDSYRRAVELDPALRPARLFLAKQLLSQRAASEALEHFQYLHAEAPEDREILLGLAGALTAVHRADEARPILDKLLAKDPDDALALTLRGRLELDGKRPEQAESWLRRAVTLAANERAVAGLVDCLTRQGKTKDAAPFQERLKDIQAKMGRLESFLKQAIQSPQDAGPRCEIGKTYLELGDEAEGLHWLHSALAEEPGHEPTHRAFIEYYRRIGRPDLAAPHENALLRKSV